MRRISGGRIRCHCSLDLDLDLSRDLLSEFATPPVAVVVIDPEFEPRAEGERVIRSPWRLSSTDAPCLDAAAALSVATKVGPRSPGELSRRLLARRMVREATGVAASLFRPICQAGERGPVTPTLATTPERAETYRRFVEEARRPRRSPTTTCAKLPSCTDPLRAFLPTARAPAEAVSI